MVPCRQNLCKFSRSLSMFGSSTKEHSLASTSERFCTSRFFKAHSF
uniref:Uncharacterized protein n=1 Tax=Kalanchoe fedtschenkoi TaxID=63787 RepID=A0A7N0TKJ2_KALFE